MLATVVEHPGRYLDRERVRVGDAARYLGVHPNTLRRGRPPAYPSSKRVGPRGDRTYSVAELAAYLDRDR